MQKNPFGLKGDFITAPNISRMFSEMIAVWILGFWENLGTPKKINLVELGAGNGEMMKIFLETFKKFPAFLSSCNILIHEKSLKLKKIQKNKLDKEKVLTTSSFFEDQSQKKKAKSDILCSSLMLMQIRCRIKIIKISSK